MDGRSPSAEGAARFAQRLLARPVVNRTATSLRALAPAARRRATRARDAADEILAQAPDAPGPPHWRCGRLVPTDGDVAVFEAGLRGGPCLGFAKLAATPAAGDGLALQRDVLDRIHDDARTASWSRVVPRAIGAGTYRGIAYLIEQRVPGDRLERALADPDTRRAALQAAVAAIAPLHAMDAHHALVDDRLRARLVDEPAALVAALGAGGPDAAAGIASVVRELTAALAGSALPLGWVHGDYWPGNILVDPAGVVTGIIDWEYAHPNDLPALDIVNLLICVRMVDQHREFGRVVTDVLGGAGWSDDERALLSGTPAAAADSALGTGHLVLLAWLRHVGDMLSRRPSFAQHRIWVAANVTDVLDVVAGRSRVGD